MDPTTHHEGLDNEQVRNLIASGLRDFDVQHGFYSVGQFRQMLVDQLEQAKTKLEKHDQGVALRRIADQFGWKTHEPEESNNWSREMYSPETYRQFVGTKEEFDQLYNEEAEEEEKEAGCEACVCNSCDSPYALSYRKRCAAPEGHVTGHEPLYCGNCQMIWYEYKREELEMMSWERLRELGTDPISGGVPRIRRPQMIEHILRTQERLIG